ncbi:MAG: NAD(P)-dependent alcohol dehydrogenase [Candidatus Altiarchaeia archaeon]
MKALVCTKYGPLDSLKIKEVDRPVPKEGEVRIKVRAVSVNYSNIALVTGKPFLVRLMGFGLLKPKINIPGSEIAGTIDAVGRNVVGFKPGEGVFGDLSDCGRGGFAEYVCAPVNALAHNPVNLSFEEAACVPEAALVALQGLRDAGKIKRGCKVLICGSSGGIGSFAVQIAKSFGAEVTGVCGTRNFDLVRKIGADHVIDYAKEDFSRNGRQYDLILATAGYRSIFDYRRALSPNGIYVATGGSLRQVFEATLLGPLLSAGGKKMGSMLVKVNKDLADVKGLIEGGKVKPLIDRCYPLCEAVEALGYYQKGHAKGRVVISVEHNK